MGLARSERRALRRIGRALERGMRTAPSLTGGYLSRGNQRRAG